MWFLRCFAIALTCLMPFFVNGESVFIPKYSYTSDTIPDDSKNAPDLYEVISTPTPLYLRRDDDELNVEDESEEIPEMYEPGRDYISPLRINSGIGFNTANGNSSLVNFNPNLLAALESGVFRADLGILYNYARANENTIVNDYNISNSLSIKPKGFPFSFGSIFQNSAATTYGLDNRTSIGFGFGLPIKDNEHNDVILSLSGIRSQANYESDRFGENGIVKDSKRVNYGPMVGFTGSHLIGLGHNLSLTYGLNTFLPMTNSDEYRVLGNTFLNLPISGAVNIQLGLQMTYDNLVLEGKDKLNRFFNVGFSVSPR